MDKEPNNMDNQPIKNDNPEAPEEHDHAGEDNLTPEQIEKMREEMNNQFEEESIEISPNDKQP